MKRAILVREPEGRFPEKAATLLEAAGKSGATLCYVDPREGLPEGTDVLLTLGGDGTFLSSLPCVRDSGIPVAGINLGRLGFLTAAEADSASEALAAIIRGDYSVRERSLLKVSPAETALPEGFYPYALNEISFSGEPRELVAVALTIDSRRLPVFWADGLVVATPTGSTAWSLSLGGPIVLPDSQVAVITPIAPHNLNVRPMVVPLDASIEVAVTSVRGRVVLSADDRTALFASPFRARITRGEFSLRCISLSDNNFIDALRSKLHWGEDGRQNHKL